MNLLDGYTSDEDDNTSNNNNNNSSTSHIISTTYQPISSSLCVAPIVSLNSTTTNNNSLIKHNQTELFHNPRANVVLAPQHGPAHPYRFNAPVGGTKQVGMGRIEETNMESWTFDDQYQTFQRSGFAIDSETNVVLGDYEEYVKSGGDTAQTARGPKKQKRKRDDVYADLGDDSQGPWATEKTKETTPAETADKEVEKNEEQEDVEKVEVVKRDEEKDVDGGEEEEVDEKGQDEQKKDDLMHIVEPDEEEEMWEKVNERKINSTLPPRPSRGSVIAEAKSTFHGHELVDYQGRPWTTPPSGLRPELDGCDHDCFIPKKCVKKYTGHTKGVQAIQFFPGTGHLLLSGGLEGKCKIWDVYGDRNCKRTYIGHQEGVKAIQFSNDGLEFLSSGYDRYIRLWDVETGQVRGTFSNRKMGYDVKFYPNDNNIFLVAASDNKIYQWDVRTGEVCQEYNYHLQPCNTITFFDNGRKFVSTSDDKKILVWEYDIPVPIKYISDPGMHSVPSVTVSPDQTHFVGQSMDNTVVVYQCGDKVKQLRKKLFKGHNNSGYACQVGFSPNMKFLISGDGTGKLNVWDWKTTKPFKKFQAHEGGPCIGAVWHPLKPSWIATCGWDGLIKLWD